MLKRLCVLVLAVGCVVPGRVGRSKDGPGIQVMGGIAFTKDVGAARVGGGPMFQYLGIEDLSLFEVGVLGSADIVLFPLGRRTQAVLATQVTASIGPESSSLGSFVGPGYAFRTDPLSNHWHTIALGLIAQRFDIDGYYPAWATGIGLQGSVSIGR